MSSLAANPFGFPFVLVVKIIPANEGYLTRPDAPDGATVGEPLATRRRVRWRPTSFVRKKDENSALGFVCRPISRFLGHCYGGEPAPGGNSLFCFGCAALRVTVSLQNLFGKYTEKVCQDPP